ncbi:MAG: hypothetical protein IKW58_02550 [Alphaproteobacteria bacterium]|nr:hypothetical protein [Alphaproteobacteria bacterium]
MLKVLFVLILSILFSPFEANAFEFKRINKIYDMLEKKHSHIADLKKISITSMEELSKFDKNFRIYSSKSKIYVYYQNNLIDHFLVPNDNHNSLAWRDIINNVLSIYCQHSPKISKDNIELQLINTIAHNIDKYSRMEENVLKHKDIDHKIIDNVIYIKTEIFYNGLAEDIKGIVNSAPNVNGLILDFRNNVGGNFNEALKVSDLFLDNALITYSVENGNTNYYTSQEGDLIDGKKIVVLVNNNTASAAEIVAGALGEQSRAIIVGTRTFGKGSLQSVYHVKDNNLYITSGYTYTPSGKKIDEVGITPQICTGIENSCNITDSQNSSKDILTAINLIKSNFA